MKKADFITNVAEKTGLSKKDVETAYKGIFAEITEVLKAKDSIQITDFGTFSTVDKPARTGRNPHNGETISIPAQTASKFKPSSALKAELNK